MASLFTQIGSFAMNLAPEIMAAQENCRRTPNSHARSISDDGRISNGDVRERNGFAVTTWSIMADVRYAKIERKRLIFARS